jgi:hypothetical protein
MCGRAIDRDCIAGLTRNCARACRPPRHIGCSDRASTFATYSVMQAGIRRFHQLWTTRAFEAVRPPVTALIADDDAALAEALAQALAAGGLKANTALGGVVAIRATRHWTPPLWGWTFKFQGATAFMLPERFGPHPVWRWCRSSHTRHLPNARSLSAARQPGSTPTVERETRRARCCG